MEDSVSSAEEEHPLTTSRTTSVRVFHGLEGLGCFWTFSSLEAVDEAVFDPLLFVEETVFLLFDPTADLVVDLVVDMFFLLETLVLNPLLVPSIKSEIENTEKDYYESDKKEPIGASP